ncbi:MAG TPA: hypothetical protein VK932_04590 [Kofleriaceae bacterium]|nr:hypothetical protein [Kofleriaceae bacterium]
MRPRGLALLGLLALLGALGCKGKPAGEGKPAPADAARAAAADAAPAPAVPDRIEGTLTLDGEPLDVVKCRPGREGTIYLDLVTAAGALRFVGGEATKMYWNPRPDSAERGAAIECTIPHRSWGGGTRADGTSYFRGELAFSCRGAAGAFEGKLSADCGDISPGERRLLDESRRKKREELGVH